VSNEIYYQDFPKIKSPFVRKEIEGRYLATPEIEEGYEWVFEDDSVMAVEKLDGTNVGIVINNGEIVEIYNRKNKIPIFQKGKSFIVQGLLEAFSRGYVDGLKDGVHYGELIGPKLQGNPYNLDCHVWIPFHNYAQKHLRFKSWGKYPKNFETIYTWFQELIPLYSRRVGKGSSFIEGIMFTHPDGRMAKVRRDMFDWYFTK